MFKIDRDECIECGLCKEICPVGAINKHNDYAFEIGEKCVSCSLCSKHCPISAIAKV